MLGLLILAAQTAAGGEQQGAASVELACRLLSDGAHPDYKTWAVQLRNTAGEALRETTCGTGDTARFKKLRPAIYVVCISGENGRSRCESVDLFPPPGERYSRFTRELSLPKAVIHDPLLHTISRARLAVPRKAQEALARSEQCRMRGDHEGARDHLERALTIWPNYPEAMNNLATRYHRSGNYRQSIRLLEKLTKIDPDFYAGWLNLGGSLLASGQFRPALEAQRRALSLRPDDVVANAQAGMCHYYLREYADAKKYYSRVAELDPASATFPQLYLAHIAMAQNQHVEAQQHIRSFLSLHPHSPRSPYLLRLLQSLPSDTFATHATELGGEP
jgi:tetratricopeptide (TPR) repeat protein